MSALVTFGYGSTNYLVTFGFFLPEADSTLTVEDGSGKIVGADSYCSVAYADSYHDQRGNVAWAAATTPQKDHALRLATDNMTQRYRLRWLGQRVQFTQSLDWPRYNVPIPDSPGAYRGFPVVIPMTVVPDQVMRAEAEFALRVILGLDLNPDQEDAVKSKKVGPIEVTYEFGSKAGLRFNAIEMLLQPMLLPASYYAVRRS